MKAVVDQSVFTRSLKRKLHPAEVPARKRRALAPLDNLPVENRPALGMRLRPRSRSDSPKESAPKKKPSPPRKKDSPPPSVIRPDAAVDAHASEGMILRPRQKYPTEKKPSPPQPKKSPPKPSYVTEKKKSPTEEKGKKKSPTEEKKGKKRSPTEAEKKKKSPTEEEKKGKKKSPTEGVKKRVFGILPNMPYTEMSRYVKYNSERMISANGFTGLEYDLCSEYMKRRNFEYLDPSPEEPEHYRAYIDQIRQTKGYGVTLQSPPFYAGRPFRAYRQAWERNAEVREYVRKMITMALDNINIVMFPGRRYEATGDEIENLVKSLGYHFLSFQVHQGTPTNPPYIVEALFLSPPGRLPIVENLKLREWKIKKGSKVVFCTARFLED